MRIGELAKLTNCHVETIRYYHNAGLLFKARKMANGYGDYSKKHLAHLRLIRSAKDLGFTQKEMIELVSLANSREESCDKVHSLTERQLVNVMARISALEEIKSALTILLKSCENNALDECPALTELLGEPTPE